jgi:hypothetical protein
MTEMITAAADTVTAAGGLYPLNLSYRVRVSGTRTSLAEQGGQAALGGK